MVWYKLSDLTAEIRALKKTVRNQTDIIHYLDGEHSPQYLPGVLGSIRLKRVKLVGTFHQPAELLPSLVIKEVIAKLDSITLVSPEQVAFFEPLVPADRIRVILHGIDTDYFKPQTKSADGKKFTCITVGHYLRDFRAIRETAIKMQGYRNLEFCVVTAKPTGLEGMPNVTIHKNVTDARLLEIYQQANILFLPLMGATANNALLEGIACGLPVISTDLPSVRVYVPGEEAVLIKDNDPDALLAAIVQLLHNPAQVARMGHHARHRAEELSWRKIAPQYEALYSTLMRRDSA
jgi:glycosyltransferase involved in cell wall biosynthesis